MEWGGDHRDPSGFGPPVGAPLEVLPTIVTRRALRERVASEFCIRPALQSGWSFTGKLEERDSEGNSNATRDPYGRLRKRDTKRQGSYLNIPAVDVRMCLKCATPKDRRRGDGVRVLRVVCKCNTSERQAQELVLDRYPPSKGGVISAVLPCLGDVFNGTPCLNSSGVVNTWTKSLLGARPSRIVNAGESDAAWRGAWLGARDCIGLGGRGLIRRLTRVSLSRYIRQRRSQYGSESLVLDDEGAAPQWTSDGRHIVARNSREAIVLKAFPENNPVAVRVMPKPLDVISDKPSNAHGRVRGVAAHPLIPHLIFVLVSFAENSNPLQIGAYDIRGEPKEDSTRKSPSSHGVNRAVQRVDNRAGGNVDAVMTPNRVGSFRFPSSVVPDNNKSPERINISPCGGYMVVAAPVDGRLSVHSLAVRLSKGDSPYSFEFALEIIYLSHYTPSSPFNARRMAWSSCARLFYLPKRDGNVHVFAVDPSVDDCDPNRGGSLTGLQLRTQGIGQSTRLDSDTVPLSSWGLCFPQRYVGEDGIFARWRGWGREARLDQPVNKSIVKRQPPDRLLTDNAFSICFQGDICELEMTYLSEVSRLADICPSTPSASGITGIGTDKFGRHIVVGTSQNTLGRCEQGFVFICKASPLEVLYTLELSKGEITGDIVFHPSDPNTFLVHTYFVNQNSADGNKGDVLICRMVKSN